MKKATELLNEIKERYGLETDYALAKHLQIPRQDVSRYYAGQQSPNEYACLQIAKALGRSYEEIQAIIRIEAEKDESRRKVWREYYKSIGGYAASIMMTAIFVTSLVTWPTDASAKSMGYEAQVSRIQIMRFSEP